MSSTQIISFEHRRGSYKAEDCRAWLRRLIVVCHNRGIERPTFIIDNAPVHVNLETVLQPEEDVEVLRLAPYSYLLNPIELLWSSFKSRVKNLLRKRTPEILNYVRINNQAITISEHRTQILEGIAVEATGGVPLQQLLGFANHVERYYAAVLREEDLTEA